MKKGVEILIVLLIATVMSVVGAVILSHSSSRTFQFYEFIIPSCVTWLILFRFLREAPLGLTAAIGFLSPFIGGVLYSFRLAFDEKGSLLELLYAPLFVVPFIHDTWQTTIPIGVVTAFIINSCVERRPLPS